MPKTATKRVPKPPPPGSYWTAGSALYYIAYSTPQDDVLYLEDCRTAEVQQMRLIDWRRCSMRRVIPA